MPHHLAGAENTPSGFHYPIPFVCNIAICMRSTYAIERIDECACMRENDREREKEKERDMKEDKKIIYRFEENKCS